MGQHMEACPVGCRCAACKADEIQRVSRESFAVVLAKATKLIEAMASECETQRKTQEHRWRTCRRCLAHVEAETEHGRMLLTAVLRRLKGEA